MDTKGLPPAQGRNPSLNGKFCHQEAGSSLIKFGKRLGAGSSLIKIGKGRIQDLTGDVRLPEVDHLG